MNEIELAIEELEYRGGRTLKTALSEGTATIAIRALREKLERGETRQHMELAAAELEG